MRSIWILYAFGALLLLSEGFALRHLGARERARSAGADARWSGHDAGRGWRDSASY